MYKIYTSYFSSGKYNPKDGVSVARYVKFDVADKCPELYPSADLLKWWKGLSKDEQAATRNITAYTKRYMEETLSKLDVHKLAKKLDGKVLLCYENLDNVFCHREVIQVWFEQAGYLCGEL